MTTEELRRWHAVRAGWKWDTEYEWTDKGFIECWVRGDETSEECPFPATIDGAASAMPPGWDWSKDEDGWQTWQKGSMMQNLGLDNTGDEIHDRYLLAKLAWEAMAAPK